MKELIDHAAVGADVRAGLTKFLSLHQKVRDSKALSADLEKQLKALTEDQSRLRENLKIIPQTSEHYEKFLEKFVTQEAEIDGLQKLLRQAQVALQEQQRQFDQVLAKLTAE